MRRVPVLALLALLLAVPVAHAGPPVAIASTPENSVLEGPVLAGGGAAWVVRAAKVRLGVPGAGVHDVFDAATAANFPDVDPAEDGYGLAGSDGALVFTAFATRRNADDCDDCSPDQLASTIEAFGPPAGPLGTVAPVHADGRFDLSRFAADGTTVAAVETVVGAVPALVLRDVKAGTEQRIPLGTAVQTQHAFDASQGVPGRAYRVALSPTRAAVLAYQATPAVATMFDRATGKELFHTSLPADASSDEIGISSDGTALDLAWLGSSQKAAPIPWSLATATAAAPVPKVVGQTPLVPFGSPVLRNGLAAFQIKSGAFVRPATQAFDGTPARPAGFPSESVTGIDVRGTELAWATPGCIYEQALPADPTAGPPAGPCPRAITSFDPLRGNTTGRKGHRTLPLALTCVAEAAGCHARVRIKLGKDHPVADASYHLRNGQHRLVHVPLRPQYDRLSDILGLAKLRIAVSTKDSAGRVVVRTAVIG